MGITYKTCQRKNPQAPNDPKKWYPVAKAKRKTDFEEIAKLIEHSSTASRGDILLALDGLVFQMIMALSKGEIVQVGDFGTFRTTIRAKGVETEKQVTSANFTKAVIQFLPGPALKNMLKSAAYERIASEDEEVKPDPQP